MQAPTIALTPDFDHQLATHLAASGGDLSGPARVARDILALSDFYLQHPGAPTPWNQPYCKAAYLSYFLPLNTARLMAVMRDVRRFLPFESIAEIVDFGAGLGATQWALEAQTDWNSRPLTVVESDPAAQSLYRELQKALSVRWPTKFAASVKPGANALAVFSYSFLEMQNVLPDLTDFSHLLIVEPSTQDCGRKLMQWRSDFMKNGFAPLAPCTHSLECPLLVKSARDWCHMRVHFTPPDWFHGIEERLPMKNRTLTYSYLLMSRTVSDSSWRGTARAVGDTLVENGKTRQMICRGPEREFLSWLHKLGTPPAIPHGALIRGVEGTETKGAELRASPGSLTWEF